MEGQLREENGSWTEDPRYAASNREFAITAVFFAAYTILTIGVAWLIGGGDDAADTGLILGFPAWFFWSTLVLGAAFCAIPYFLVKHLFTEMSLEADPEADTGVEPRVPSPRQPDEASSQPEPSETTTRRGSDQPTSSRGEEPAP